MKLFLNQLEADPRNPNVCSTETMEKLKINIQRTKLCPALIVRPHPTQENQFIIIDGHHRKQVLEALGWKKADCQIWDISEQEAQLALATLNRLRGIDIPYKRAELLASLTQTIPIQDLSELLPENEAEIKDLIQLMQSDFDHLEQALKLEMEKEKEGLPIPYTFLIQPKDIAIVDGAFTEFAEAQTDRAQVLVRICSYAIAHRMEES